MFGVAFMDISDRIKELRIKHGLTQEKLAQALNVTPQSISKWESDVAFPETEKLVTLSKLYQCSIDYLLNEDSDEKVKRHGRSKYNTKKLPLIIMTLGFFLLTYFVYGFVWYGIDITGHENYMCISTYQLLFTSVSDIAFDGNLFAVLYFTFGFVAQGFAIAYIFLDWKGLATFIKVSNILYFVVAALALSDCFRGEMLGAGPGVLCAFSFVLCVLQFAVPAIRKTH